MNGATAILVATGEALAGKRELLVRSALVPGAAVLALSIVGMLAAPPVRLAVLVASFIAWGPLGVALQRTILCAEDETASRSWRGRLGRRELRFVLAFSGAAVLSATAGLVTAPVYGVALRWSENPLPAISSFVASLPALYCFARLGLVLPCVATDRPASYWVAWKLARGSSWRLLGAMAVPALAVATVSDVGHLLVGGVKLLNPSIGFFATCIEMSILAVAYRQLAEATKSAA